MDQPIGWFLPSPSIVWQVSLVTGRLANSPTLQLYTGLVHRVIWPVRKESDFASNVPERESNSSCTAQVWPLFRGPYPLDQHSILTLIKNLAEIFFFVWLLPHHIFGKIHFLVSSHECSANSSSSSRVLCFATAFLDFLLRPMHFSPPLWHKRQTLSRRFCAPKTSRNLPYWKAQECHGKLANKRGPFYKGSSTQDEKIADYSTDIRRRWIYISFAKKKKS